MRHRLRGDVLSQAHLLAAVTQLFPQGVRVAVAPIDAEPVFAHAEEAACVSAAVAKRQAEFATGRRLAHSLLAEWGANAAPLLPAGNRAPIWPAGVVGTISHSRQWCVVAVATGPVAGGAENRFVSLGIDVEPATPLQPRLWRNVLLPAEQAWLGTLDEPQRGVCAKLIFSAKECVYKAIAAQLGQVIGFLEVELSVDVAAGCFAARLVDDERAARVTGALTGRFAMRDEGLFTAMAMTASC